MICVESTTKLEELDQFYKNAIDELNQQLLLKDRSQTHLDNLRNQLASCLSTDSNSSLDELIQQIIEQVKTQKFDFDEKYQALERENEELRLGECCIVAVVKYVI